MKLKNIKHMSTYADPYCDEVFELWSHADNCNCKGCSVFFGVTK